MVELDPKDYTEEQIWFVQKYKNLIGNVLDVAEVALPDKAHFNKVKQMLNRVLYDGLTELMNGVPHPYGFGE